MTNLERPELEPMLEPAPSVLTIKEVHEGTGVEAPVGGTVKVHYLGVDYETGEEFDSSWGRGEPIEFPLNRLIKGWQAEQCYPGLTRKSMQLLQQLISSLNPPGLTITFGPKTLESK